MADLKVVTPEAIISFPALFEPTKGFDTKKYGCTLVFPPGTDLTTLKNAYAAAAKARFGDKAAAVIKGQKSPTFQDDAEKCKRYGYPEGSVFISVTSNNQPGVVSTFRGEDGKPQRITDPKVVYSGAIVRASLYAHAYDTSGNRGVTFFLNNVQKLRDGERLDGRVDARDEFEATDDPVDLSELEAATVGAGDDAEDLSKLL